MANPNDKSLWRDPDGGPTIGAAIFAAVAVHALLWSFLPPLYIGNLHTDTVEAISWATNWDLGYPKHPPLVVWTANAILALPGSRMLNFLLLSQATVAISAALIWRTVRLYASPRSAALGALIYLASPPATYFAMQVNHNSLSIPFGAAILLFGLRYLEERRGRDIACLGLIAGLALLIKYQTAFFLIALIAIALVVPRFRWVWVDPRSYAGAALSLALIAPHLWWDYQHGWRTLLYASADRPLLTWRDFGASLNELLDGLLMCAVGPLFAWLILGRPGLARAAAPQFRLGFLIAATPILVMIVLGFASGQIMRQGWLIPLLPGVAVGLALMFAPGWDGCSIQPRLIGWRSIAVSAGQVAAFAVFLLFRAATGHPVAAYSLDGDVFSREIGSIWRSRQAGPIPCILMPNRSFALSAMLHLSTIPQVHDLDPAPLDPDRSLAACRPAGGLVIVPEGAGANAELKAMGLETIAVAVPAYPRIKAFEWIFEVYVIPPG